MCLLPGDSNVEKNGVGEKEKEKDREKEKVWSESLQDACKYNSQRAQCCQHWG